MKKLILVITALALVIIWLTSCNTTPKRVATLAPSVEKKAPEPTPEERQCYFLVHNTTNNDIYVRGERVKPSAFKYFFQKPRRQPILINAISNNGCVVGQQLVYASRGATWQERYIRITN